MTVERGLRLMAGLFVFVSLALALGESALVSLHRLCGTQLAGFTNWCHDDLPA